MRVYIDQDLCTGDGLCVEICPDLFEMHSDGLAYVKEASWPSIFGPDGGADEPVLQMASGCATIPEETLAACEEAAEDCPGCCIFIEGTDE